MEVLLPAGGRDLEPGAGFGRDLWRGAAVSSHIAVRVLVMAARRGNLGVISS